MKINLELNMGTDSGTLIAVLTEGVNNLKRMISYIQTDAQRVAVHNGIAVGEQFIKQIESKSQSLVDQALVDQALVDQARAESAVVNKFTL